MSSALSSLKAILILSSHICLRLQVVSFVQDPPTQKLCIYFSSPCAIQFVLRDWMTRIAFGEITSYDDPHSAVFFTVLLFPPFAPRHLLHYDVLEHTQSIHLMQCIQLI
jgi:hypothetical protein